MWCVGATLHPPGGTDSHRRIGEAVSTTRSIPQRPSAAVAFLVAGVVFIALHMSLETGSLVQSLAYDLIGAVAVGAAVYGTWRHQPDRWLPWLLMAAGQALFVGGDVLWVWYEAIGEEPFPSLADALYLSGYPFVAAGLFLLIRRRVGDGDRGGLLDAAILTTAVAVLSWTFLMRPQVVGSELDMLSLSITLAYPIADLLLIGVAMGLLTTPGARTPAFAMLGASLACLLVADQVYALQTLEGSYVSGSLVDNLYLASYLLFGASALHHSMRKLTDPHPVPVTWLGPIRLLGLAAAMLTGPVLLTFGPDADGGLAVIAFGTALLSLLVLARLVGLVVLLARDVAQRRVLESQLKFQAFHDPLTALTNRRRFMEATRTALAERGRPGSVAALFLDLDDFKTINDTLGHAAGDDALIAFSERLRSALRDNDVAARLGGDEFGVLLRDLPDQARAVEVAERLLATLSEPFVIDDMTVGVGASIGIALDGPDTLTVDDLLGDADVAMYRAKAQGKGRYHVFGTSDRDDHLTSDKTWLERGATVRRTKSPRLPDPRLEPGAG
jgi:diguanylate cyclase (GGDEF)-like protein